MSKHLITRGLASLATAAGIVLLGCGTDVSEGNLPESKPYDPANVKADTKKLMEGMKGMYKGAPGAPKPRTR